MSLDVEKLREKTKRLITKEKLDQAIKVYRSSLGKHPEYPDLWCELASLQKTTGDAPGSGESYFKAAEFYVKAGQDRHALAACKKAVELGDNIPGARRLLNVLVSKIKEAKSSAAKASKTNSGPKSMLRGAPGARIKLGRVTQAAEPDYAEVEATPLPPPLSALMPVQRRQASDFQREPTSELDLEQYEEAAHAPSPHVKDKQLVQSAPPPPPVTYWEEMQARELAEKEAEETGEKPAAKPAARPARDVAPTPAAVPRQAVPKTAARTPKPAALRPPDEKFMVLSRRDPAKLLGGLRSGITYGIAADELAKIDKLYRSSPARRQAVLKRSLLFEKLTDKLLKAHVHENRFRTLGAGEAIAESGSGNDSLHTIIRGEARVLSDHEPPIEVARLRAGAVIGEQSFVGTVGMRTRVETVGEVELLSLDRPAAEELFTDHPASMYAMLRVVEERVVDNMLSRAGFFRLFTAEERDRICPRFEILEVADDEVIIEQGTPSKTLCLLMSGTIELGHTNAGGQRVMMLLDPGGVFGEESLIDGRPSVFTARTTARSWIMLLRREEFLKIYESHPELTRSLKDVARRRRSAMEKAASGKLELTEARWPDFDPDKPKTKQLKPTKDRGKKKKNHAASNGQ